MPPDPGPAGTTSVLGVDQDRNDVRDDVDRFVAASFQASAKKRYALRQLAVALQQSISARTSSAASIAHAEKYVAAVACAEALDPQGFAADLRRLWAAHGNTKERLRAQAEFETQLAGQVVTVPAGAPNPDASCTFNWRSLAN